MDEVVTIAPWETESQPATVAELLDHYGARIVGNPLGIDDASTFERESFDRYVRAASALKSPELSLNWELVIEFLRQGRKRTDGLTRLLDTARHWTPDETAIFHLRLVQFAATEHYMHVPNGRGETVAEAFSGFAQAYKPELIAQRRDLPGVAGAILELARRAESQSPSLAQALLDAVAEANSARP